MVKNIRWVDNDFPGRRGGSSHTSARWLARDKYVQLRCAKRAGERLAMKEARDEIIDDIHGANSAVEGV